MAYTRVWNNASPTGAEAANTLDNIIRNTKVDLTERFDDFLIIADFTADPLRLGGLKFSNDVQLILNNGAPTSGLAGTGVGQTGPGSICINFAGSYAAGTAPVYVNVGTKASPTWAPLPIGDSI